MKSVKGKLLKKLKTVKTIGYLKPESILLHGQASSIAMLIPKPKAPLPPIQDQEEESKKIDEATVQERQPEIIDVSDLEDVEMKNLDKGLEDKENISPNLSSLKPKIKAFGAKESWVGDQIQRFTPLSEIDVSSFRRPDLNSSSLFDPNLLAAFEQAVMAVKAQEAERMAMIEETIDQIIKEEEVMEESSSNPLLEFEEKCPPGGSDSVILYTTGLRGIRKTFEDCQRIRFLLENFRVLFFERDVSMHREYRDELWRVVEGKVVAPRLFIKGRYIGGAEEVLGLHEQGKFKPLLDGIPLDVSQGHCEGCGGMRFVLCFRCNGSSKILLDHDDGDARETIKCPACNENGLIVCPLCSLS